MPSVKITDRIPAPVDKVWDLVGDFGGIGRFSSGFKKIECQGKGVGAVRTITLPNDAQIQERCELLDPARKTLDYSIVSPRVPSASSGSTKYSMSRSSSSSSSLGCAIGGGGGGSSAGIRTFR